MQDAFTGTADYYDRYRPGVPDELVRQVVSAANRDTQAYSLLDLGTGTGKVLQQFLPDFSSIVAVEPNPDMLQLAKRRLIRFMSPETSIYFLDGSAEVVQLPLHWSASLVTICRAFHWMDRPRVLQRLDQVVQPGGTVAIFGDKSLWNIHDVWADLTRIIIQDFLGEQRRAGDSIFTPPDQSYTDELKVSPFSAIQQFSVPVTRTWTIDQLIGLLYSSSFSAKALFGERAQAFEDTLRERLLTLLPDGKIVEENEFEVIIARRP